MRNLLMRLAAVVVGVALFLPWMEGSSGYSFVKLGVTGVISSGLSDAVYLAFICLIILIGVLAVLVKPHVVSLLVMFIPSFFLLLLLYTDSEYSSFRGIGLIVLMIGIIAGIASLFLKKKLVSSDIASDSVALAAVEDVGESVSATREENDVLSLAVSAGEEPEELGTLVVEEAAEKSAVPALEENPEESEVLREFEKKSTVKGNVEEEAGSATEELVECEESASEAELVEPVSALEESSNVSLEEREVDLDTFAGEEEPVKAELTASEVDTEELLSIPEEELEELPGSVQEEDATDAEVSVVSGETVESMGKDAQVGGRYLEESQVSASDGDFTQVETAGSNEDSLQIQAEEEASKDLSGVPGVPSKFCINCGIQIPMSNKFCVKCGTKM